MKFIPILLPALLASLLVCQSAPAQTPEGQPGKLGTASANAPVIHNIAVGDADNGESVTLHTGDTLSVSLDSNPSTGYNWNLFVSPDNPLHLDEQPKYSRFPHKRGVFGSGGFTTYDFTVQQSADFTRSFYLRFLYLRPFDKGIAGAKLWEIKVTIPGEHLTPISVPRQPTSH